MPLRVVTLPPQVAGAEAVRWATRAREAGADVVEVRNDLHAADAVEIGALGARVLVAQRSGPLSAQWLRAAWRVDLPLEAERGAGASGRLGEARRAGREARLRVEDLRDPARAGVAVVRRDGAADRAGGAAIPSRRRG